MILLHGFVNILFKNDCELIFTSLVVLIKLFIKSTFTFINNSKKLHFYCLEKVFGRVKISSLVVLEIKLNSCSERNKLFLEAFNVFYIVLCQLSSFVSIYNLLNVSLESVPVSSDCDSFIFIELWLFKLEFQILETNIFFVFHFCYYSFCFCYLFCLCHTICLLI